MIRGGSWNNNPANLRSANRNRNTPTNRNNNIGFRLARTLHSPELLRSRSQQACTEASRADLEERRVRRPRPASCRTHEPGRGADWRSSGMSGFGFGQSADGELSRTVRLGESSPFRAGPNSPLKCPKPTPAAAIPAATWAARSSLRKRPPPGLRAALGFAKIASLHGTSFR